MAEKGPMSGSSGRIPGPYVHDVKVDDGLMVYPPFPTMDIGARKSGLPSEASMGPKSIEHVGDSDGTSGKGKHRRGGL
jgi:hypothetical protein